MNYLRIIGGRALQGELEIQGAKNSVLPILAATLLNRGQSVLHRCPRLQDVDASIRILRRLGCSAEWEGDTLCVHTGAMACGEIPDAMMREMRSSVIFLGAILARCGHAVLSYPGGCELGPRPIDLHLAALRAMGVEIEEKGGYLHCCAQKLRGCEITLSIPSVGATENVILAACGAEGATVLCNAARAVLRLWCRAAGRCTIVSTRSLLTGLWRPRIFPLLLRPAATCCCGGWIIATCLP